MPTETPMDAEEPGTAAPPPAAPRRRWGRVVAWCLALLFLVPVVLLVGARAWLSSASGGAFVRTQVLAAAAGAIDGRVEIGRVELSGLLRIVMYDISLSAPGDATPAVVVQRLEAHVDVMPLRDGLVSLPFLDVDGVKVDLVETEQGWNLLRAVETRPSGDTPEATGPRRTWVLRVAPATLDAESIEVRRGESRYRLAPVALTTSANGPLDALAITLDLKGAITAPVERTLALSTALQQQGSEVTIRAFDARAGASALVLDGSVSAAPPRASLSLATLQVSAADLTLAAGREVLDGVSAKGRIEGSLSGAKGTVDLALPAGKASLTFEAAPAEGAVTSFDWKASLAVDDVVPGKLVGGLPPARLVVKADLQGRDLWPDGTVAGVVDLRGTRVESLPLDTARVRFASAGRSIEVSQGQVSAAGVDASVQGRFSLQELALTAGVSLPSLVDTRSRVAAGLPTLVGDAIPPASGSVELTVTAEGPVATPKVETRVVAPSLAYGGNRLSGLQGVVGLQRWTAPYAASAKGTLKSFDAGALHGRGLRFDGRLDEKGLLLDLAGRLNDRELHAKALGRRIRGGVGERWEVPKLSADALGLTLSSTEPVTISWDGRRLELAPALQLNASRSGPDRASERLGTATLSAAGNLETDFVAEAEFAGFDLSKLPRELLPTDEHLGGVFSGSLTVKHPLRAPAATADVTFAEGRIGSFQPLSGRIDVTYEGEVAHAVAKVQLPGDGAVVELDAKAPVAVASDWSKPVAARLTANNLELASLAPFVASLEGVSGTASMTADVSGSPAQPVADVSASVGSLSYNAFGPFDVKARVGLKDRGLAVSTRVTGREKPPPGGTGPADDALVSSLEAATSLDAAALLRGTRLDWRSLPASGHWRIERAELARFPGLGLPNGGTTGRASADFKLSGTLAAPKLEGELGVVGLSTASLSPLDVRAGLRVGEHAQFDAEALRNMKRIARADVKVLAPTKDVLSGRLESGAIPLSVKGTLDPTTLAEFQRVESFRDAVLAGSFDFTGTANEPRLHSSFDVTVPWTGGKRADAFRFELNHQGGFTKLIGRSPGGNSLDLDVTLKGQLGLASLQERLAARRAREGADAGYADVVMEGELAGHLVVDKVDLGLFDGRYPDFRDVGGLLTTRLHVRGTGHAPALDGDLVVTKARVSPYEYGVLSGIELAARMDWPKLKLTRLDGNGLQGTFASTGELVVNDLDTPAIRGRYDLRTKAMPLVKAYQTRAWLSMVMASTFEVLGRQVEADVTIAEGQLRVPDSLPRRVQDLDPHPDIVFEDRTKELVRTARRWEAKARVKIADDFNVLAPMETNIFLGADLLLATRRTPGRTGSYLDITGPMRLPRGQFAFLGRRFELDPKAQLRFQPGAWDDPQLGIKAYFEGRDGVKVTVEVGGTPEALETTLTSSPSMEQAEIVYYLTTGQRQLRAQASTASIGTALTDSALSAAGSVIAGAFKSAVDKFVPVPLDVFTVEADVAQQGARVRAGKYINDRLYIGGQYNPAVIRAPGANLYEVEVEYRIADDVSGKVRFGDGGQAGGEVLYQRDFWAPEQKRRQGK